MSELSPDLQKHLSQLNGQAGFAAKHLGSGKEIHYGERRFLAASTIKLPLLAAFLADWEAGRIPPDPIPFDRNHLVEDSPAMEALPQGTPITWLELARWMMVVSDNTATNLVIEQVGFEAVRHWLDRCQLPHTQLNRLMVDLDARARGIDNWTTPGEMLTLLETLVRHQAPALSASGCRLLLDILQQCQDLEKIPFHFRPPVRVANKPGELPGTRSDVGYVFDGQHQVIMSLFTDQLHDDLAADLWLADLAQLLWSKLTQP